MGPRAAHESLLLPDGRVLLLGGITATADNRVYTRSVEVFDPSNNSITKGGETVIARLFPAVAIINAKRVLIAGGQIDLGEDMETDSLEEYDISAAGSRAIGHLCFERQCGDLFKLSESQFLLTGGFNSLSEKNSSSLPSEMITVKHDPLYHPSNGSSAAESSSIPPIRPSKSSLDSK